MQRARRDSGPRPERVALALAVVALVCALAAPAASQQPQPAPPNQQTTKRAATVAIGVAVPLSGEYAPLGERVVEAAELAGREAGVTVVARDTRGEPRGAIEAIEALAGDPRVVAVVGPIGLRESRAAASVARRHRLPLFVLHGDDDVTRLSPWIFRAHSGMAEQATVVAEVARREFDHRRAAILYPRTPAGRKAAVAFATAFIAQGGTISAAAGYDAAQTDWRKPLDVLTGQRAWVGKRARVGDRRADADGYVRTRRRGRVDFDALFIPDSHVRVARILPFLPGAGVQTGQGGQGQPVQLLGVAAWQGDAMRHTGAHAAGAVYADAFAGEAAGGRVEEFALLFESETTREPVDLDAEVFDVVWLLGGLAESAARGVPASVEAKPASVAAARRRFVVARLPRRDAFGGVTGQFSFDERGSIRRTWSLYQFDVEGTVVPWR